MRVLGEMRMKSWIGILAMVVALGSAADAEAARRLGGGASVGRQSPNVTQREAQRPQQPAQQNPSAQPSPQPAPAGAAPAPAGRTWAGMLGGLAAGLGLAWLAHSLGLGAAFGQVLLFGLLAILLMSVVGWVARSRRTASQGAYAYARGGAPAESAVAAPQYNPEKVGNDASARPWERSSMAFEAPPQATDGSSPARIGSALEGSPAWGVPAGFDVPGFVEAAKRNFVTLQDAWDRADIGLLRSMMTDAMLAEIRTQLAERERQLGGAANRTEVVVLEAQLLGIEDLGDAYMASVEFSGVIREEPAAGPTPFREVWNMTKPRDGSTGWLVAGVQALQ
jgi:predicted lipid-binding transport protein (Tim44 family)